MAAECEMTESLGGNRLRLATTVHDGEDAVLDGEAVMLVEPPPAGTSDRPAATDG